MAVVTIDAAKRCGKIKPVHGVCNGPLSFGGLTDLSVHYKNAGFPFCRLHDTDYAHPISVDVPQIFPDFNADETDPKNYRFANTDQVIDKIYACGAEVIYRLGTSIEHTAQKVYTTVPVDADKWARVCVQIIRHYNEGWADGRHYGIRFWEIWNEADLNQPDMWQGTPEQYYHLYVTAAKAIKRAFPTVFVGGPALAGYGHADFANGLLQAVKEADAPLDFFSWHLYCGEIAAFKRALDTVCGYLDCYGFGDALLVCDEWNYNPPTGFSLDNDTPEQEEAKYAYFGKIETELGAAFCGAVMTFFQYSRNDIATYYDGQPTNLWCGIFDWLGRRTKAYYAFAAFDKLYRLGGECLGTASDDADTYAVAAAADGKTLVLLSRYGGKAGDVTLTVDNAAVIGKSYTVTRINRGATYETCETGTLTGNALTLPMEENEVALLSIE